MSFRSLLESSQRELTRDILEVDFGYEYPDGLNLRPGRELHDHLVQIITDKATASKRLVDVMLPDWRQIDRALTAYMPASDVDKKVLSKDPRKPVNVVIPQTFASLEYFLTYMASAFLSDDVIYKYTSTGGPEYKIAAELLQGLIRKQGLWFKERLSLLTQCRDAFAYGIGVTTNTWEKQKTRVKVDIVVDDMLAALMAGDDILVGDIISDYQERVLREGTKNNPIDPYNLILDPNACINDIQRSEFVGWLTRGNAMECLANETDPEYGGFNGKYVRILADKGAATSRFWVRSESGRGLKSGEADAWGTTKETNTVDHINIFMNIIPRELGLGKSDRPEKWKFRLSGDTVITECTPLNLDHGMYPVSVAAPNSNGHDLLPVSHLMTTYGLQQAADWSLKSRMDNVRKVLNDMLIYDPSKIESMDLMNPAPGKLIRVKESVYGNGRLDQLVMPLPVQNVTQGHINEMGIMLDLIERGNGTSNISRGDLSGLPERPGQAGIDLARTGGLSRLQLVASIIASQSLYDNAFMQGYNTLQFLSKEEQVEMTGELERSMRETYGLPPGASSVTVTLDNLSHNFDVVLLSGAMPQTENVQAWNMIMQTLLSVEGAPQQLMASADIVGLFRKWAKVAGSNDVNDFIPRTSVAPDAQVDSQAQAGNLVPFQEAAV